MVIVRKIVRRNKYGIEMQPEFSSKKVVFYRIINPSLASEGEVWKGEIIEEVPLNKKDKRGVDMYVCNVHLVQRVEEERSARYKGNHQWEVEVYSGDLLVKKILVPETGRKIYFPEETFVSANSVIEMISVYKDRMAIADKCTLKEAVSNPPEWLKDNTEKINKLYKITEYKESLLRSSSEMPIDIVSEFLTNSCDVLVGDVLPVVDYRMPLFGYENSIFAIGDFKFKPIVDWIDSYATLTDRFETKTGEIQSAELRMICKFAAAKKAKWSETQFPLALLGIDSAELPKEEILFEKKRMVYFESHNRVERYLSPEEEEQLKKTFEKEVEEFLNKTEKGEEKKFSYKDLIEIVFQPKIETSIGREHDSEYGVGAKDNSYWITGYLVARCTRKYNVIIKFSESVHEDIRKAIVERVTK